LSTSDNAPHTIGYISDKYLNAFLNTAGGALYFGIADNGRIHGLRLDRAKRDLVRRSVDGVLQHHSPSVEPDLYRIDFLTVYERAFTSSCVPLKDRYVVRIHISRGRVSMYQNEARQAWIRRDGSLFRMDPDMIRQRTLMEAEQNKRHEKKAMADQIRQILAEMKAGNQLGASSAALLDALSGGVGNGGASPAATPSPVPVSRINGHFNNGAATSAIGSGVEGIPTTRPLHHVSSPTYYPSPATVSPPTSSSGNRIPSPSTGVAPSHVTWPTTPVSVLEPETPAETAMMNQVLTILGAGDNKRGVILDSIRAVKLNSGRVEVNEVLDYALQRLDQETKEEDARYEAAASATYHSYTPHAAAAASPSPTPLSYPSSYPSTPYPSYMPTPTPTMTHPYTHHHQTHQHMTPHTHAHAPQPTYSSPDPTSYPVTPSPSYPYYTPHHQSVATSHTSIAATPSPSPYLYNQLATSLPVTPSISSPIATNTPMTTATPITYPSYPTIPGIPAGYGGSNASVSSHTSPIVTGSSTISSIAATPPATAAAYWNTGAYQYPITPTGSSSPSVVATVAIASPVTSTGTTTARPSSNHYSSGWANYADIPSSSVITAAVAATSSSASTSSTMSSTASSNNTGATVTAPWSGYGAPAGLVPHIPSYMSTSSTSTTTATATPNSPSSRSTAAPPPPSSIPPMPSKKLSCAYCLGFFLHTDLVRHTAICTYNPDATPITPLSLLPSLSPPPVVAPSRPSPPVVSTPTRTSATPTAITAATETALIPCEYCGMSLPFLQVEKHQQNCAAR
jgi:hypothetical protein